MNNHGKYNYILNNCRHFSQTFMKNIKVSQGSLKSNISSDLLNSYIKQYFYDNLQISYDYKNNNTSNSNKNNSKSIPLSWVQVIQQFDSLNRDNIVKSGFLSKKSKHLGVWHDRYCVLTRDYELKTYKNIDMKECTATIQVSSNLDNVAMISLTDATLFTVESIEFKAQSYEIKKEWIEALRKVMQLPPPSMISTFFDKKYNYDQALEWEIEIQCDDNDQNDEYDKDSLVSSALESFGAPSNVSTCISTCIALRRSPSPVA